MIKILFISLLITLLRNPVGQQDKHMNRTIEMNSWVGFRDVHNFPVVVDAVGDYFDDYGDNEMVEEDD